MTAFMKRERGKEGSYIGVHGNKGSGLVDDELLRFRCGLHWGNSCQFGNFVTLGHISSLGVLSNLKI